MMPTRSVSLWLFAVIATTKTEAGLVENYPFPTESEIPKSGVVYSPINFATVASLDLDMRSIDAFASVDTLSGLEAAKSIFQKGGYSDSVANLMILDPQGEYAGTTTVILPGATVVGQTASGVTITGIAKYGKTEVLNGSSSSGNVLQVHYPKVALENTNQGCFVGGNPVPIIDGCTFQKYRNCATEASFC